MPKPIHLTAADYPPAFPPNIDAFPSVVNEAHYIDAWIINRAFTALLAIEQYLIDNKAGIEE
jgi:hypothetical protein